MNNDKDKIKELLEVLEGEEDEVLKFQDDVLQFLDFYNLKNGNHYIRAATIHKLYILWSQNPVTRTVLLHRLDDYLNPYSKNKKQYYKINKKVLNLTTPALESLAKTKKRIKLIDNSKINEFLKDNKIEAGVVINRNTILFRRFREWISQKGYKTQIKNLHKFTQILAMYLEKRMTKQGSIYFKINKRLSKSV